MSNLAGDFKRELPSTTDFITTFTALQERGSSVTPILLLRQKEQAAENEGLEIGPRKDVTRKER